VQKQSSRPTRPAQPAPPSLETLLVALDASSDLSDTRRRDLRCAVRRVAELLGNVPAAVPLMMDRIQLGLNEVNPIASGITIKRFNNIRSDFLSAVRASGLVPSSSKLNVPLAPEWVGLFSRLRRPQFRHGLSRMAHYASAKGIGPAEINDEVIDGFLCSVRLGSLHRKPNDLHRQVTSLWNKAAADTGLGLRPVTVPSFRATAKRVDQSLLPATFLEDQARYLEWCAVTDPFAPDARDRPLAPRTLKLTKDQIHAAVTALVKSGQKPEQIRSLADVVTIENLRSLLRQRVADAGRLNKSFDHYLARALVRIAKEWVEVDAGVLAELKKLASKLPAPNTRDLTLKNKRFLGQFEDPAALRRLKELPDQLWKEVKADSKRGPNFRVLAKAQAALALGLLTYMPVRSENLCEFEFGTHIFLRTGARATSTLELNPNEVKNDDAHGFDIPKHLVKMLQEYRDLIAPIHTSRCPTRLFVNPNGAPKAQGTVAWLIRRYAKRAGIKMTPHQFRHLGAKVALDAEPGNFTGVGELLGHRNSKTTMIYAGINTRRAGRHHQELIDRAVERQMLSIGHRRRHAKDI
jgi:integrase